MNAPTSPDSSLVQREGLIAGLGAYLIWGLLPLFFVLLKSVDAGEVVANRILWSSILLIALVEGLRRREKLMAVIRHPRTMLLLTISSVMIAINWLVYIWAVLNEQVLAGSLGYFLNPLVNVVLGMAVLGERLSRVQGIAVALAASGVAILALGAGSGLWISMTLALSFSLYGLIRKVARVDALEGLTIETLVLAAPSAAYLFWLAQGDTLAFGSATQISVLLIVSGAITAVPLMLFAAAARRMPLSTLGLLQYIAPTMQFLLAVLVLGEPLTAAQLWCFALIWSGLAIYAVNGGLAARRNRRALALD